MRSASKRLLIRLSLRTRKAGAGAGSPLTSISPRVHVLEEVADQPTRVFRDHDFVRASDGLQPRCKVWRLANDGLLLPSLVSSC